ncbi:MAG TPA: hypothetical protein VGN99_02745 [Steroidobacteraceae bacterium]|nr:hypothetical protein [Steroidobacteraceae bacterium]
MPEVEPVIGTICPQTQPRCGGLREHTLMAFTFISCVCGGEALAKDRTPGSEGPFKPGAESSAFFALPVPINEPRAFSATVVLVDEPRAFSLMVAPIDEPRAFSATEFRPRRQSLSGADPARHETSFIDAPMMDTSVARQWRESKSQDRVRLLTLWRSSVSSVSLQAGKHGMPSLQWSTPWMHRDVASRGLFDRFLTVSPRSGGSRGNVPRQTGTFAASKPADLSASLKTQ